MRTFIRTILELIGGLTLGGILIGCLLMFFAGYWMDVNDEPIKADYILPLAGDGHRMITAAELYNEGYAPVILLSNAVELPPTRLAMLHKRMGFPSYSREEYLNKLFPLLGVENVKLESFGNGHVSTVEEAEALKAYFKGQPHSVLIVTSPYHARRSKMIFESILPDCSITVTSTEEDSFDWQWWKDQRAAQNLVMEFAKTIHYLLGGAYRAADTKEAQAS